MVRAIARRRKALVAELLGRFGNAASVRATPREPRSQLQTGPSDPDRLKAALSRVHSASLAEDTEYAVLDVAGDGGDKQTLAEVFDWAGHVDHVLVTAGGISGTGPP